MKVLIFLVVSLICAVAFADDAVVVAVPTYLDSILAWLTTGLGMVVSAVSVLEVIMRLIPSVKPLTFLIPAKYAVDGVVAILAFVSLNILSPMITSFNASSLKLK